MVGDTRMKLRRDVEDTVVRQIGRCVGDDIVIHPLIQRFSRMLQDQPRCANVFEPV
jgi:hypothetical protein